MKPRGDFERVRLPWGDPILVRPAEVIGALIWYYGIFDLIVAEAIQRLLEPADIALDVGANIGQMTSLMSKRSGPQGCVHAFEPHPELFHELECNARLWGDPTSRARIDCHSSAVSDRLGQADLILHDQWQSNRGLSSLNPRSTPNATPTACSVHHVALTTLDALLPSVASIGVCKIDVEGHELQVLQGASGLLRAGKIRDIIFEDFHSPPSPLQTLLKDHGYTLYSLATKRTRPVLGRPGIDREAPRRDGSNFLATLEPKRAEARFAAWGWRVLRG